VTAEQMFLASVFITFSSCEWLELVQCKDFYFPSWDWIQSSGWLDHC